MSSSFARALRTELRPAPPSAHNPRMLSRRAPLALFLAVALGLAPSPRVAEASTVVPVTLETLAHRADEILVVTPRHATAQWIGNVIDTDYDLEVQSVVRGSVSVGGRVTLRAPGGI